MDLDSINDINQLKALAYDCIVAQEQAQMNLQAVNNRLTQLVKDNAEKASVDSEKTKKAS